MTTTRESNEDLVLAFCATGPKSTMEVGRACGVEGAHALLERLAQAGALRRGVRRGELCLIPTYEAAPRLCERCRQEVA